MGQLIDLKVMRGENKVDLKLTLDDVKDLTGGKEEILKLFARGPPDGLAPGEGGEQPPAGGGEQLGQQGGGNGEDPFADMFP